MKAAGSRRDRIRAQLADLKMPGALEAVDDVLTRVDATLSASHAGFTPTYVASASAAFTSSSRPRGSIPAALQLFPGRR